MTQFRSLFSSQFILGGLAVILPTAFLLALPWLKHQPDITTYTLGMAAALGTIACSFMLAVMKDRKLDEWHRSAARFSNQWGWLTGAGLLAILQGLPACQDLIISASDQISGTTGSPDKVILLTFMLGFASLVVLQTACILLLSLGWRFWMSRTGI